MFCRLIVHLGPCLPKSSHLSMRRCCTTGICVGRRHRRWEVERTSWRSYRATSSAAQTNRSFCTERTVPDSHQSLLTPQFKYVIFLVLKLQKMSLMIGGRKIRVKVCLQLTSPRPCLSKINIMSVTNILTAPEWVPEPPSPLTQ